MTKEPEHWLYHTTGYSNVAHIQQRGLDPSRGGALFRAYADSRGKVFFAEGKDAALGWFSKIEDMLADRVGDSPDAANVVPVMLRLRHLPKGVRLSVDEVGTVDVIGHASWFTKQAIPPSALEFWNPEKSAWAPLEEWDPQELAADLGVSMIEFYDEDGDPTDEETYSFGVTVFGPYEYGGFKPNADDAGAWDESA